MDIMKAVNIISHTHLLRKLYLAELQGRWWILKENFYTKMGCNVTWNGQLGERFPVTQGNGQAELLVQMISRSTHMIT